VIFGSRQNRGGHGNRILVWFRAGEASEFSASLIRRFFSTTVPISEDGQLNNWLIAAQRGWPISERPPRRNCGLISDSCTKLFSARSSIRHLAECVLLWLDNNLTLHALVPKTAGMATLKGIRSWSLGNELNHGRFPLLELPAFLLRCENESGFISG